MNPKTLKIIEALKKKPDLYNEVREYLIEHPLPRTGTCYLAEAFFDRKWNFFASADLGDLKEKINSRYSGNGPWSATLPRPVPIPDELRDRLESGDVVVGIGEWPYDRDPPSPANLPTVAWVLQLYKCGNGGCGISWSLWENEESAKAHAKWVKVEGGWEASAADYFYEPPRRVNITPDVAALLMKRDEPRSLPGKGDNAPSKNTRLTRGHFP